MASDTNLTAIRAATPADAGEKTVFKILLAISFCHLLNDTVQSLIPAIYPILRTSFHLNLGQIGLIALTSQVTASLLQPLVGLYTDRRPQPYSLTVGMGITLIGQTLTNQFLTYTYLPHVCLSNAKNRESLPITILEIFDRH